MQNNFKKLVSIYTISNTPLITQNKYFIILSSHK